VALSLCFCCVSMCLRRWCSTTPKSWVLCLGHTGWLRRGTRTRARARTQTWHNCCAYLLHLFQSAVLSLTHSLSLAGDLRRVTSARHTGWLRPIGCLMFIGHFLQKSPIISGSFAERARSSFALSVCFLHSLCRSRTRRRCTTAAHIYSISLSLPCVYFRACANECVLCVRARIQTWHNCRTYLLHRF